MEVEKIRAGRLQHRLRSGNSSRKVAGDLSSPWGVAAISHPRHTLLQTHRRCRATATKPACLPALCRDLNSRFPVPQLREENDDRVANRLRAGAFLALAYVHYSAAIARSSLAELS